MKNLLFLLLMLTISITANAGVTSSTSVDTTIIAAEPVIRTLSDREITEIAKKDARRDYKNPGEIAIVLGSLVLFTALGSIAAVLIILNRPVNPKRLKLKDASFTGNQLYNNAYLSECREIRKRRLWIVAGVALFIAFVLSLLLFIVLFNGLFIF